MTQDSKQEQEDRDLRAVKQAASLLKEHFDSVQIFATRYEGEQATTRISFGLGDFYSRYGLADLWLKDQTMDTQKE